MTPGEVIENWVNGKIILDTAITQLYDITGIEFRPLKMVELAEAYIDAAR